MASFVLPTARQVVQSGATLPAQWVPMTGWIPAISVKKCRILMQLEDTVGNLQAKPGYQVATTTTKSPGSRYEIGSYRGSDGKYVDDLSSTTFIDGHMWVRFGVICYLSSTGYGQSEVHLSVSGSDQ